MDDPVVTEDRLPTAAELSERDPVFRYCPHARLDRLRAEAPRWQDPEAPEGRLFLTRFEDVRAAMADRSLSRDPRKAPQDSYIRRAAPKAMIDGTLPLTVIWMDDPDHRMYRSLLTPTFSARAMEARRAAIEAVVDELLDELQGRDSFDLVADFAYYVPSHVIAQIMGLPKSDLPTFRTLANDIGFLSFQPNRTPEQNARFNQSAIALAGYFMGKIVEKRAAPGDDLISSMIAAELDGRRLNDAEIMSNCMLILAAGMLTVTDAIGNGVVLFKQNPGEWQKILADPSLMRLAVDEVLRIDPPISTGRRHVNEPTEYMGCPLQAGGYVTTSLLAANHDPEVYPDPQRFDVERGPRDHTAFGGGAHYCLGAPMARLELEIALWRLLTRFPNLRLLDAEPERRALHSFRGYETLRVAV